MGEMLNEKKVRLVSRILALEDELMLDKLEKILSSYLIDKAVDLDYFTRPIRENITIEDLIQEQHSTPIVEAKMDAISVAMDIQEPVEELLAQLTP